MTTGMAVQAAIPRPDGLPNASRLQEILGFRDETAGQGLRLAGGKLQRNESDSFTQTD